MPRIARELGPLDVKRLKEPGYHAVGKVPGLMLQISATETKSWVLRVKVGDKRREIGLGPYPAVGLALAHQKAQEMRDKIASGIDPVVERVTARQAIIQQQLQERALSWTFRKCAEAYIRARAPGWRNVKHAKQWEATLETYVYPTIGNKLVGNIDISDVISIVEPHWTTKTETINRVRNRIELILDWATVRKYRSGDNPARWKGNLDKLLARRSVVAPIVNHRALDASDIFGFLEILRTVNGTAARCLEFVVLTACRSGEARLATWDEIDFETKTWNIPAVRMKAGRKHSVPLSKPVITLLKSLPQIAGEPLIFPGRFEGKPLSDMAMTKVMRDMGVDAVPHGFRASFSSWCASETAYPAEVREMALAHAIGDATQAAYQRSDLFEKRRRLMADWANHCTTMKVAAKVIPMSGKRKAKKI
jgi:integrase